MCYEGKCSGPSQNPEPVNQKIWWRSSSLRFTKSSGESNTHEGWKTPGLADLQRPVQLSVTLTAEEALSSHRTRIDKQLIEKGIK